jgi:hypothetical protein
MGHRRYAISHEPSAMIPVRRSVLTALCVATLSASAFVHGQQGTGQTPSQFPLSVSVRERGSSVTGAYEGWFYNKDGSISLLLGYFNRNTKQEFDLPPGPNNRIEPGGPDMGQPTHFLTGRQWGVFSIRVPKDFGTKKLTWTIVTNGQTNVITMHTKPEWILSPFEDPANKNTPPVLKFAADGPPFTGPPTAIAATYTSTLPNPLPLTVWATDEGPKINIPEPGRGRGRGRGGDAAAAAGFPPQPPLVVSWSMLRGPAAVKFDNARPTIDRNAGGKTTTTATFTEPGEYILRVQGNDSTGEGGGGFQCCWTNAHVKVTVKPAAPSGQ